MINIRRGTYTSVFLNSLIVLLSRPCCLFLSDFLLKRIFIVEYEFFHVEIIGCRASKRYETITVIRIRAATAGLAHIISI